MLEDGRGDRLWNTTDLVRGCDRVWMCGFDTDDRHMGMWCTRDHLLLLKASKVTVVLFHVCVVTNIRIRS